MIEDNLDDAVKADQFRARRAEIVSLARDATEMLEEGKDKATTLWLLELDHPADIAREAVEVAWECLHPTDQTPEDLPYEERKAKAAPSPTMARYEFPRIVSAKTFMATDIPEPPQVIHDVLHRGGKGLYGGPSKTFKSWTLEDLCIAVSTGEDWLGFQTAQGPALYMNFELQPFAIQHRLKVIAADRGCEIPDALHLWNLRGHVKPLSVLLPELLRQIRNEGYHLIIPDPIYKTLGGRDENSAGDIGELCSELDAVAVETGAAIVWGAHFAKGNASSKEHMDRVSGSGVWERDPDAVMTATRHEDDGAFTLEMTLRNMPPVDPFVIRWDYPRMRRDDVADPDRLAQPHVGRTEEFSTDAIVQHLKEPMRTGQWFKVSAEELGISRGTFYRRMRDAERMRQVVRIGELWQVAKKEDWYGDVLTDTGGCVGIGGGMDE